MKVERKRSVMKIKIHVSTCFAIILYIVDLLMTYQCVAQTLHHDMNTHRRPCAKFQKEYKMCKCKSVQSGVYIDCNRAGLKKIPVFPTNTYTILFKENNVSTLPWNAFGNLTDLQNLNLETCQIRHIHKQAFIGLPHLYSLKLASNYIKGISADHFKSLPALTILDISGNCDILTNVDSDLFVHLKSLQTFWANGICAQNLVVRLFANNEKLKEVQLNNNDFSLIPKALVNYSWPIKIDITHNLLGTLKVEGVFRIRGLTLNVAYNNINRIEKDDFVGYDKLHHLSLDMRNNGFLTVHKDAFIHVRYLSNIELANNPIGVNISNLFKSLHNTHVRSLKLQNVNIQLTSMSPFFFYELQNVGLRSLDLRSNLILRIQAYAFSYLKNLTNLKMEECSLASVHTEAFGSLKRLFYLEIGRNHVTNLHLPSILKTCPILNTLKINSVGLKISGTLNFPRHTKLRYLDLSDNFINGIVNLERLANLVTLRMDRILPFVSAKWFNLYNLKMKNLTKLATFTFVSNKAYIFKKSSIGHGSVFEGLYRLKELKLNQNNLYQHEDMIQDFFSPLRSLQRLDLNGAFGSTLSKNTTITPQLFENLRKLEILNLDGNRISYIHPKSFENLHRLEGLNMKNNLITTLKREHFENLARLRGLNVLGNAFACTCELRWFASFVKNNPHKVKGWDALNCKSPPSYMKERLVDFDMPWISCDNHAFHVILSCALVSLVIIVVVIMVLYFRWDIRYYIIALKMRRKRLQGGYRHFSEEEYDVFVCYQEGDRTWVLEDLIPNLERQEDMPFKLCIHDRDFIPGHFIIDNIVYAIQNSRKLLFLISRAFVKSSWCEFELNIAQSKVLDEENNIIVFVFLEQIEKKDMPKVLRCLVRHVTYLEWPESERAKTVFWKRLRIALSDAA